MLRSRPATSCGRCHLHLRVHVLCALRRRNPGRGLSKLRRQSGAATDPASASAREVPFVDRARRQGRRLRNDLTLRSHPCSFAARNSRIIVGGRQHEEQLSPARNCTNPFATSGTCWGDRGVFARTSSDRATMRGLADKLMRMPADAFNALGCSGNPQPLTATRVTWPHAIRRTHHRME